MHNAADQTQLARQFAAALDACDYPKASRFLAADCRYHISQDDVRLGMDAILESYRESDARARRDFDSVRYRSEAAAVATGGVRLTFIDELYYRGSVHSFRCSQIVYFDGNQRIERIELVEIPGERRRLNDFCSQHGIRVYEH